MAENITDVTDATFDEEVLKSDLPVLVDYWAVWCGPCRMITPIVEKIAEAQGGKLKVVKVNVDESPSISAKYGIMSIPTLLLFKDGEVQETIMGVMPEKKIIERILPHL